MQKLTKLYPATVKSKFICLSLLLLAQLFLPILISSAHAGALTYNMVRFDRMKASTATTGTVCAKPSSNVTETSVKVTFPTGFTVSSTVGNWSVGTTSTSWPADPADGSTPAASWTGISAPTGSGEFVISGQSVTFVSGNLTAGTWYCFNWTSSSALSTSTSGSNLAGSVVTQTTGGAASDTGNFATAIVSDDQILVTATVTASFSFSLSGNSAALNALTTGGVSASPITATVSTNSQKGYSMWAADYAGTPGLTSAAASKTLPYAPTAGSAARVLSAEEGINIGAGAASCSSGTTPTIDTKFASLGTSLKGGGLDNTPRLVATSTGVANSCAIPLTVNAIALGSTPAATDYESTMTIIVAGRF